jgi:hypothetical protein
MATMKADWQSIKSATGKATASVVSWILKAGDVGDWIETNGPLMLQVIGDFGVEGRCLIEGTHDKDAEPVNLMDPSGHSSVGAAGMIVVPMPPRFIRPVSRGGDSKTSLKVITTVQQ